MKLRVAKKIIKNKNNLEYNKGQVRKAETTVRKWKKNEPVATK